MSATNLNKEGIEVKVGQTWEDLDKRMRGRQCQVLMVDDGKARMDGGRRVWVSIKRMHRHSTGWKLVKDAP